MGKTLLRLSTTFNQGSSLTRLPLVLTQVIHDSPLGKGRTGVWWMVAERIRPTIRWKKGLIDFII